MKRKIQIKEDLGVDELERDFLKEVCHIRMDIAYNLSYRNKNKNQKIDKHPAELGISRRFEKFMIKVLYVYYSRIWSEH